MSSIPLPSAANNYAAPPAMPLSKAAWDAALTDVGARLVALEAVEASFDALIAEGTAGALSIISTNVGPQLAALVASIATEQSAVTAVQGQLITAQNALTTILAGTLPATSVIFAPTGPLTSTTTQAAIAEVSTDLQAAILQLRLRANIMSTV